MCQLFFFHEIVFSSTDADTGFFVFSRLFFHLSDTNEPKVITIDKDNIETWHAVVYAYREKNLMDESIAA